MIFSVLDIIVEIFSFNYLPKLHKLNRIVMNLISDV